MTGVMTVLEARDRVDAMAPGETLCYYVGFLLADRASRKVAELGDFFLRAGVENAFMFSEDGAPIDGMGLGHLTQLRVHPNPIEVPRSDYMYLFTKAA